MPKIVKFEGKTYSVPDDATMEEIQALIDGPQIAQLRADGTETPAAMESRSPVVMRPAAPVPVSEASMGQILGGAIPEMMSSAGRFGSAILDTTGGDPNIQRMGHPVMDAALGAASVANMVPSAKRAGEGFKYVMDAAKNVPLNLTKADDIALAAMEMGGRGAATPGTGSTLPKVFADYIRRRQLSPTMTFETGRKFATKAGSLSVAEKQATDAVMGLKIKEFSAALKEANRQATQKVGMGKTFDQATKEYRQHKQLADALKGAKKFGKKLTPYVVGTGIGAEVLRRGLD